MPSRTLQRKQPPRFAPKWKHALRAPAIEATFPERMHVSNFEQILREQYPMLQLGKGSVIAFCYRNGIGTVDPENKSRRILSREDMIGLNRTAARTADLFHSGNFYNPEQFGKKLSPQRTKTAVHIRLKNASARTTNPRTGKIEFQPDRIPFIRIVPGTTIGADYSGYLIPKHVIGKFDSIESREVEQRRKELERKREAKRNAAEEKAAESARIAGERRLTREQEAAEKRKKFLKLAAERTSSQSDADKRAKRRAGQKTIAPKKATIKKALPKGTAPKATATKPATPKPPANRKTATAHPARNQAKGIQSANSRQTIASQGTAKETEAPAETKSEPIAVQPIHANPLAEAKAVYDEVYFLRDKPEQQTAERISKLLEAVKRLRAEDSPARRSFDAIAAETILNTFETFKETQREKAKSTPDGHPR